MADPNPDARSDNNGDAIPIPIPIPTEQTPLLNHQIHQQPSGEEEEEESRKDELSETLDRLERFLTFLGFKQNCFSSFALSWTAFFVVGVLPPILVLESSECLRCSRFQIKDFEIEIVVSQACLAAVSLLCLSHNLRKYGVRRFLFVDRHNGHEFRLRDDYVKQISNSFRLLILWALPIFVVKTGREILRVMYSEREADWCSVAIMVTLVVSWSYVSTISLTASIMFHLVCNLQVIHFDEYGKLLGRDSDVLVFIEDHIRLRYHLSKISHRFRIFLLLQFVTVTASQFVTLLQITGYSGLITIINGGDFAVSSLVQVVGIIICLHAATRISHRAQNLASMASRWHALVTCGSHDQHRGSQQSVLTLEGARVLNSMVPNYSESDLESLDYASVPTHTQLASYMSSYHRRQAFVMYLQTNPGGITIFGWTVDRGLINTIFFIELTLITFLLGKTIVFTSA